MFQLGTGSQTEKNWMTGGSEREKRNSKMNFFLKANESRTKNKILSNNENWGIFMWQIDCKNINFLNLQVFHFIFDFKVKAESVWHKV